MTDLSICINRIEIRWDAAYGPVRRRGWTLVYHGSTLVQFVGLSVVLVELWRAWGVLDEYLP